jgi:hypothetical protein
MGKRPFGNNETGDLRRVAGTQELQCYRDHSRNARS